MYYRVLLPLKLEWIPTYSSSLELKRGQAVSVRFANRSYIGVVWDVNVDEPAGFKVKPILSADTAIPDLSEEQMQLWEFTASYYLCSLGEVYKSLNAKQNLDREGIRKRRIDRLEARMARLQSELTKKHRSSAVVERLEAELKSTQEQIEILASKPSSSAVQRRECRRKPLLLIANQRISTYITKIRSCLASSSQVLVLSPTIAHFSLLEDRLRAEFGELLLTYNSHTGSAKKSEVAECLRSNESAVILGTRSSIFLPFRNLALIIVDFEHDSYYKQSTTAPRYNGRDLALFLAYLHGSEVVLGSSAPSLETLYNYQCGKYDSLRLDDVNSTPCQIIDLSAEKRKNGMHGTLSRKLIDAVILYQAKVYMIRGWEKEDEVKQDCAQWLPGKEINVLTLNEFLSSNPAKGSLVAVLGADAYLSREDFRSDERAIQLVSTLRALSSRLIIQSNVPQRFEPSNSLEALMEERRQFGFPPYKRIVELRKIGTAEIVAQHYLPRDSSLNFRKAQIMSNLKPGEYIDVDPDYGNIQ